MERFAVGDIDKYIQELSDVSIGLIENHDGVNSQNKTSGPVNDSVSNNEDFDDTKSGGSDLYEGWMGKNKQANAEI